MKLVNDYILVEAIPDETVTSGGLILQTTQKSDFVTSTVVDFSESKQTEHSTLLPPKDLKIGSKVLFSKKSSVKIEIDSKPYLLLHYDGLIAVEK